MLDDLKYIHNRDSEDALGWAAKQPQQLQADYSLAHPPRVPDVVVYAAAEDSFAAGWLSQTWFSGHAPFVLLSGEEIPTYTTPQTSFIAASYDGNSHSVLGALMQAEARQAQITVITSGGELAAIAEKKHYSLIQLPRGLVPRYTVIATFVALLSLLRPTGIYDNQTRDDFRHAQEFLEEAIRSWSPVVAAPSNLAKQLALEVVGKSVVLYSSPKLAPLAYSWKAGFNQTAKQLAWSTHPFFHSAELLGWTEQPRDKPYAVLNLQSSFDDLANQKQFAASARLLSGRQPTPLNVHAEGKTELEQLLWMLLLGDFVTIYTALANGVDPLSVGPLKKFNKMME